MIKSYVYVSGNVVTKGDKEIEGVVPYYDNVGARFVVQNEIEFLTCSLKKDEKNYKNKIVDRSSSLDFYKKIAPITGAISVAASFALSLFSVIGNHNPYVSTPFGELNTYVGTVVLTLPVTIIVGQILAGLGLVFRPSKGEIAGCEEMVKYEKEMLQLKQTELSELEKDTRKTNLPVNSEVIKVDDSRELRRHKENFKLRYAYGAHQDKIFKMYNDGTLVENMVACGFGVDSIADFVEFVEQEYSNKEDKEENFSILIKKDLN